MIISGALQIRRGVGVKMPLCTPFRFEGNIKELSRMWHILIYEQLQFFISFFLDAFLSQKVILVSNSILVQQLIEALSFFVNQVYYRKKKHWLMDPIYWKKLHSRISWSQFHQHFTSSLFAYVHLRKKTTNMNFKFGKLCITLLN